MAPVGRAGYNRRMNWGASLSACYFQMHHEISILFNEVFISPDANRTETNPE